MGATLDRIPQSMFASRVGLLICAGKSIHLENIRPLTKALEKKSALTVLDLSGEELHCRSHLRRVSKRGGVWGKRAGNVSNAHDPDNLMFRSHGCELGGESPHLVRSDRRSRAGNRIESDGVAALAALLPEAEGGPPSAAQLFQDRGQPPRGLRRLALASARGIFSLRMSNAPRCQ
eukprot:4960680-Pleurochrysis_carterae.AAC.4